MHVHLPMQTHALSISLGVEMPPSERGTKVSDQPSSPPAGADGRASAQSARSLSSRPSAVGDPRTTESHAARVPVAVVVDGWNARSQIARAFGQARHVTYPGLLGGLRPYGFEVISADLALGVEPADGLMVGSGSRLEIALAENNE